MRGRRDKDKYSLNNLAKIKKAYKIKEISYK